MTAAGHVSAPAPQDDRWAHFAVIMLVREEPQGGGISTHRDSIDTMYDLPREGQAWQTGHLWQTACRRLTSRVEDLSPTPLPALLRVRLRMPVSGDVLAPEQVLLALACRPIVPAASAQSQQVTLAPYAQPWLIHLDRPALLLNGPRQLFSTRPARIGAGQSVGRDAPALLRASSARRPCGC